MTLALVGAILSVLSGSLKLSLTLHDIDNRPGSVAWARITERCADAFKSYRPDTGMWLDYSGKHHHCPKI